MLLVLCCKAFFCLEIMTGMRWSMREVDCLSSLHSLRNRHIASLSIGQKLLVWALSVQDRIGSGQISSIQRCYSTTEILRSYKAVFFVRCSGESIVKKKKKGKDEVV